MHGIRIGRPLALIAGLLLCGEVETKAEAASNDPLSQWMETRLTLAREREAWRVERQILQDRIDLLGSEIADWKDKSSGLTEELDKTSDRMNILHGEQSALTEGVQGLSQLIRSLEQRMERLYSRFSPLVQERIDPLFQRIPRGETPSSMSLPERYQNIIGILNELGKMTGEIMVTSETRELSDGRTIEVTVLYLGLGQAYYVNKNGGFAGVGTSGPAGWIWEEQNDLVDVVDNAIGVYRNEKPAAYVDLPVRLATQTEVPQ